LSLDGSETLITMLIHQQNMVPIADRSSIGEARRISSRLAERA
jgi:hypothetical protein